MNVQDILAELVSIPDLPGHSNAAMSTCVQKHLTNAGANFKVLPGPEGDRENIFATLGPADEAGYILSGHMDVVPVAGQNWTSDPFTLTTREERLYGRGTTDMKGFLACMLATAYAVDCDALKRPLHLAFSYDEEIGCRGVGHMIARLPELCTPPLGCVIGEPSDMTPVLSHKGKQAITLTFSGQSAHSSNPDAGVNAIYPAAEVALFVRDLNKKMERDGPFDQRFSPAHSTVVAGVVHGGIALNIIPDSCAIDIECRAVPGQDPALLIEEVIAFARRCVDEDKAIAVDQQLLGKYPALPPPTNKELTQLMEKLTHRSAISAVSYGTEAGLFDAAGVPSIICGPGSITRAHKPDEYIEKSELKDCCDVLRALAN